jgi:trans-aconitate methyltransferase
LAIFSDSMRCYARYRPRYPESLIDDLRTCVGDERRAHLVDWGCGTGELTLPLAQSFEQAIGVDRHAQMIDIARENAGLANVQNIKWVIGSAEELELKSEGTDLITAASSFHWMDRELLSKRAFDALRSGGALAVVGGGGGGGVWKGAEEWHRVAATCVEKHAAKRELPGSKASSDTKQHADFLASAGFRVERHDYQVDFSWQVDEAIGYLYSVSFVPPKRLGDRLEDFESELREALLELDPSGVFREKLVFFATLGFKR